MVAVVAAITGPKLVALSLLASVASLVVLSVWAVLPAGEGVGVLIVLFVLVVQAVLVLFVCGGMVFVCVFVCVCVVPCGWVGGILVVLQ